MSTTSNSIKPDLGSLRIDDGKRRGRKTGKVLGAFAAVLGLAVIVTGAVFAFRNQTPVVEVATAQKAGGGPADAAECERLRDSAAAGNRGGENHRASDRSIF